MTTDSILDSIATTATLAVGASATGSIDFEADADWYRVTLTAGVSYRIDSSPRTQSRTAHFD